MEHDVLLQMTDICKEFPGVKALDHVSLTVKRRNRRRKIHIDEMPVWYVF